MVVYHRSMAPIGAKLWENAFQTIPDISLFDAIFVFEIFAMKHFVRKSTHCLFLRSYAFFDVNRQMRLEK